MSRRERIFGWIFLPIHVFILPFALSYLLSAGFVPAGLSANDAGGTLIYYLVSFLLILCFAHRFLKTSFFQLLDNKSNTFSSVFFGYLAYIVLIYLLSVLLLATQLDLNANPNTDAISNQFKQNSRAILVSGVLLAPIVEETLFRGVVFGTLRGKHRLLAYIVSVVAFAFYHLWSYILIGFDTSALLYLVQYVPASIVLAWTYERSGNLCAPILLHMLINAISLLA